MPGEIERLMAPWWRAFHETRADGRVTKPEAVKRLAPHILALSDRAYGKAMRLLARGKDPSAKASEGAVPVLAAIVALRVPKDTASTFSPQIAAVSWSAGSGVRPPPGAKTNGPGVRMTVQMPVSGAKLKHTVQIDEARKTITIHLMGHSKETAFRAMMPQPSDEFFGMSFPASIGAEYRIQVRDGNPRARQFGKLLASASFVNHMPMSPRP